MDAPRQPSGDAVAAECRPDRSELAAALASLGLTGPMPVLVLVGGAANLDPTVADPLRRTFESILPCLDRLGAALVDGGTAFGVMRLIGDVRRRHAARFPLIGVAASGTIDSETLPDSARVQRLSGTTPDPRLNPGARLDPDHSHFVLVPGVRWGDESAWIEATASVLAAGRPVLTLVAAGGQITRLDVSVALRAGRSLVVLAGSGGTADLLADAWRSGRDIPEISSGPRERALVQFLDLAQAPRRLPEILARAFGG